MGLLSGLLGGPEPKTAEELEAQSEANNLKASEMAAGPSYKVTDVHDSVGFDGGWRHDSVGQDINMQTDRKGRQFFRTDNTGDPQSIWMKGRDGKWFGNYGQGGMGTGGSGISLGQVQAAPAVVAAAPTPPPTPKPTIVGATDTPIEDPATTASIMGDTYDTMLDWRPISSDGQGGTQTMNPLVDPNAWLHQIDPQYQQYNDPGRYISPQMEGLLAPIQGSVSQNPYSLLG